MTTSAISCACTPPLFVSIKGGGGLYLMGDPSGRIQHSALLTEHICSSEPRYWHSPQSTPPLAETWELPSRSRLACTPYYRHPRCKTVQCSRTPLCWTYGPTAGTRINPCVTVLPLASTSGTRNTQHHHWLGPDRRVRAPTIKRLEQALIKDQLSIRFQHVTSIQIWYHLKCSKDFSRRSYLGHW